MEIAKENNLMVHMHFCENAKEVSNIKELYNESPVEFLKQNLNSKIDT